MVLISAHPVQAAVGRTPGAFSVDASGAATYTIPINVAPGVNGLRPSVALVYDSQAGDGPLGMRWNLAGFSSVTRCHKTVATNGAAQGVTFSGADQFCLDGQPLVRDAANAPGAVYGANGTLYRTESDNYARITSYGTTNGGPTYFEVKRPDGLTYLYGNTTNARIPAYTGSSSPIRTWAVNQIQDKFLNSIRFTYNDATGDYHPAAILWTDHCASVGCTSGAGDRYKLSFEYETRPTEDRRGGFLNTYPWSRTKRLQKIVYQADATTVQEYTFGYTDPVGTGTLRSQLATVTQCGDTTSGCFTATSFQWENGVAGWNDFTSAPAAWNSVPPLFTYGDFDGDGRIDILLEHGSNIGKWSIFQATGNAAAPFIRFDTTTSTVAGAITGDFNGDGLTDLLGVDTSSNWVIQVANGNLAGAAFDTVQINIAASTMSSPTAVDYNGDGLSDLVYVRNNVIYMRRNTGAAFANGEIQAGGMVENYLAVGNPFPRQDGSLATADFDGDGRADLLVHYQSPSANDRWVAYIYGGSASNEGVWNLMAMTPAEANAIEALVLDINGDGLSDLAYRRKRSINHILPV